MKGATLIVMTIGATVEPESRYDAQLQGLPEQTLAILAAVPNWWYAKASEAGLDGVVLDVDAALCAEPPARIIGVRISEDVTAKTTPFDLGQLYVESLDPASRAKHGRHYTPEALAVQLWEMARASMGWTAEPHPLTGLVRDPACGAGALLLPVLGEHLAASSDADPSMVLRHLPTLLEGVDQDPWAVYLSNVVLAALMLPTLARVPKARREPLPTLAVCGDGLAGDGIPAMTVVMNPPYGRLKLADDVRAQYADVLFGHANIYAMFMAASVRNLTEDGVLAALVPTSFTAGLYFHKLRAYLAENAPLRKISFVHDRASTFTGVLQETCLAVFTSGKHRKTEVYRSSGGVHPVARVPSPRTDRPWLLPRESRDSALAARATLLPHTLTSVGWQASTGPLVWNRRKKDIFSRPGKDRLRIVWAADIDGGKIRRDSGRDHLRYLHPTGDRDLGVISLGEAAVLVQRTTAPEQNRRLVAAELTESELSKWGGRVAVENHINVLRPNTLVPLIDRRTLAQVLATETFDRLLRCISGSVAVSAYELSSLPMPDADTIESWRGLTGKLLEEAVASAYNMGGK